MATHVTIRLETLNRLMRVVARGNNPSNFNETREAFNEANALVTISGPAQASGPSDTLARLGGDGEPIRTARRTGRLVRGGVGSTKSLRR